VQFSAYSCHCGCRIINLVCPLYGDDADISAGYFEVDLHDLDFKLEYLHTKDGILHMYQAVTPGVR